MTTNHIHHRGHHIKNIIIGSFVILLYSCGQGAKSPSPIEHNVAGTCLKSASIVPYEQGTVDANGYTITSNWDETKVRKILNTFAYAGHASDSQITTWAGLAPEAAIVQMLSLNIVNSLLSPNDGYDNLFNFNSTLHCISEIWGNNNSSNRTPLDYRERYNLKTWGAPENVWAKLATSKGANSFRQKIGFFETNFHMSLTQDSGVSNAQIVQYYDIIMDAHQAGIPYQKILAKAALTAAVATQYNHKDNLFINGKFTGNEDFGREFHQLFFGILGDAAAYPSYSGNHADYHEHHELQNIPNTAKALTDMQVARVDGEYQAAITFGEDYHYQASLDILDTTISGVNAKEKIEALAEIDILNVEGLKNLPVFIATTLADDNLTDTTSMDKIAVVQSIWSNMATKNLLEFIRKYAISTAFFDSTRIKYKSSVDRILTIANLINLSPIETHTRFNDPTGVFDSEDVAIFRPAHDVFGAQTSVEASDSPDIFSTNYSYATNNYWYYSRIDSQLAGTYSKSWGKLIPPSNGQGHFMVEDVALWLWKRFIADGGANLGTLEKVHIWSLLGSGRDVGYFLDKDDAEKVYSKSELDTAMADNANVIKIALDDLKNSRILLDSGVTITREDANRRIGLAINFIIATPYMLVQKGND